MRPELLTALQAISEGVTLLRAGNPNHKGQGPGGGQFTSGGGSSHGKHWAKRQRQRKKKLEKLRQKGHARIAELKSKHSKERKALRDSHRKEGKSYSDRASETKALRTKHHGESRTTIDSIKKEARAAFPKATGSSSKSKEFRERIAKADKFEATHGAERTKQADRHDKERAALTADHRTERKAIRESHAKERAQTVADNNKYHQEDARYIIKETKGQPVEERRKQLEHNKQVHSGRLKDALHSQRQEHAEEHASHVDEAAGERREMAKRHAGDKKYLAKAHQMAWRAAREHLVQELKGRSYDGTHSVYPGQTGLSLRELSSLSAEHGGRDSDRELEDARYLPGMQGGGNHIRSTEARATAVRFSKHRVHKANSAEAILRHCLRQRGWTAQYDGAQLSGKQHLNLLEDVRQYGRQWMRHESESFFDRYGVEYESRSHPDSDNGGRDGVIAGRAEGDFATDCTGGSVSRGLASRATGAISRFFDRAKGFIRELIVAGTMALKGDEPLTNAEIYAVDRLTRKQFSYLDKFEQEVVQNPPKEIADLSSVVILVEPAPMTPGQFIARAESYGNAPWEVQNIGREVVRKQEIFKAERRVHLLSLEQHRPCKGGEQGCLEQSRMGWQPIGTLREIGDCFCMGSCDCYFEWQDPKGHIFVSPWGRHNPHGFNVPGSPGAQLPGYAVPADQPAIPALPSGPGPAEKAKKKIKLKLKPVPEVGKPYPKGGTYPPAKPLQSVEDLLKEAGSPYAASEYEEA